MKNEEQTKEEILKIKKDLGNKLLILTHQYQRKEIVDVGNFCGDSFALSQKAANDQNAKFIVFCGVHFMAESASILSNEGQIVQIPDTNAGCWMADMADVYMVEKVWDELKRFVPEDSIMPVLYINSDAQIKAFCGKKGGTICTSSNANAAIKWGLSLREKVLFLPDQHLGRNTAIAMGIQPEEIILWKYDKPLGGNTENDIKKAKIILWDGYCLVHTRFKVEHITEARKKYPDSKIVVHPECPIELVKEADAVGSTSFIVKYVENAKPGSTIIIGTEINLIQRLKIENPDKNIIELHHSLCPNMYKINLENLLMVIENIGKINVVDVPYDLKIDAKKALDRMLKISP
ncbi:MAG: quinolinate synthase NadA [Desulfobacterales bacterium]|nr:quinolinate synthase NadA [Desulfobacterales bacterium]MBF0395603.1 quinolinate synthase NadA [Desulfobacterales bacterium]